MEVMPKAYEQFVDLPQTLKDHYRDMQDMEFTIEDKKLYMLQTRNGKRTAQAALKIARDLVDEGMITEEKAVEMIDPRNLIHCFTHSLMLLHLKLPRRLEVHWALPWSCMR